MDRRTFLTLGPVAAGAATLARAPDAAARPPRQAVVSSFDPWIEIHSANLRHNVAEISRLADGRPILAVIKNNGYGMGVLNAAQLLEPSRAIHGFAVVKLHEAVVLRDGGVRKPILLMGPVDEPGLAVALERDIMPMVYTPLGGVFDRIATRRQRPASMHVCVDTGIDWHPRQHDLVDEHETRRAGSARWHRCRGHRQISGHESRRITATHLRCFHRPNRDWRGLESNRPRRRA
jgi:hypothetical protein